MVFASYGRKFYVGYLMLHAFRFRWLHREWHLGRSLSGIVILRSRTTVHRKEHKGTRTSVLIGDDDALI